MSIKCPINSPEVRESSAVARFVKFYLFHLFVIERQTQSQLHVIKYKT